MNVIATVIGPHSMSVRDEENTNGYSFVYLPPGAKIEGELRFREVGVEEWIKVTRYDPNPACVGKFCAVIYNGIVFATCQPASTIKNEFGFYRIKSLWRETGLRTPPATMPMQIYANGMGKSKDAIKIPWRWVMFAVTQNSPRGWMYLLAPPTGWFIGTHNDDGNPDYDWYENKREPVAATVAFCGNVVKVLQITNGFAEIETFKMDDMPPDPALYNHNLTPHLSHRFTIVNSKQQLYKGGAGVDAFVPLITNGPSCIPVEMLEPFPELPREIKVLPTILMGLSLCSTPTHASNVTGLVKANETMKLMEYAPRAGNVWGKVVTQSEQTGWVSLLWENQYLTSWEMQTQSLPMR